MMMPDVTDPDWRAGREKNWIPFDKHNKHDCGRKVMSELKALYFGEKVPDYDNPDNISAIERNWEASISPFQTPELWKNRTKLKAFDVNDQGRRKKLEDYTFEDRVSAASSVHVSAVKPLLSGYDYKFGWDITTQREALLDYYLQGEITYRPSLLRFNGYYAYHPWRLGGM